MKNRHFNNLQKCSVKPTAMNWGRPWKERHVKPPRRGAVLHGRQAMERRGVEELRQRGHTLLLRAGQASVHGIRGAFGPAGEGG